jgi:hypothetical protein
VGHDAGGVNRPANRAVTGGSVVPVLTAVTKSSARKWWLPSWPWGAPRNSSGRRSGVVNGRESGDEGVPECRCHIGQGQVIKGHAEQCLPRKLEPVRSFGGAFRKLAHTDVPVQIEKVCKLAAELSRSYYAD